jgi:hypothetical protein
MKLSLSSILLGSALGLIVNATGLPNIHELSVRRHCDDCCDDDSCCQGEDGWPLSYCLGVSCGESLTLNKLIRARRLLKLEITPERTYTNLVRILFQRSLMVQSK